jgi:hypothetical protein
MTPNKNINRVMETETISKNKRMSKKNRNIMKTKILFISFVCCLVLQANAQTYNNTIVNDNSSWSVLCIIPMTGDILRTDYYYFDGDSIFNEKTYKKVFSYRDELHLDRFFAGLIREENKKTYFVPYHIGLETLLKESILYDFSLEQGETFEYVMGFGDYSETETLYVLQSDYVLINNKQKKRLIIVLEYSKEWVIDTVIENVGSLHGLLYPLCYMCTGGFHELLCYYENNELIYKNSKYSECYYDGIFNSVQEIANNGYTIFPNPVDDLLNISYSNNAISRIEIFDISGRKVYNQTYKDIISVNSFSKGLYLLKVYDTNEQVSVFKIIKK